MPRNFVEHFKKIITEKESVVVHSVSIGNPQSFDDYRERVGKIKALRAVIVALDDELQKYIEDDDD